MKRIVFAAAAALIAVPALAADLPAPPPPQPAYVPAVAPVFTWSGFYIGANVGASFDYQGAPNNTVATGPFAGTPTGGTSHRSTGIAAGGQIGINFQNGPWVFGAEADADYLSNKATTNGLTAVSSNTHVFTLDLLSTVRGRVGYAFDRALFYGTGGFAMGDYSTTRTQVTGTVGTATPGTAETFSTLRFGWTAGGGIEYAVGGNWTVRAEYLFVDLQPLTYTFPLANIRQAAPDEYVQVVRAGLNFKFGGF